MINDLKTVQILLVEDNEGDIFLTLEAFEESKLKISVNVVRNGREALDYLYQRGTFTDAKQPDLILLDINIPIYNGHEVLKQIKSDENLKIIPVIMLTTSSNQKDVDKAYENFCHRYLQKPLEMEAFMQAILEIEDFKLQLTTLSE